MVAHHAHFSGQDTSLSRIDQLPTEILQEILCLVVETHGHGRKFVAARHTLMSVSRHWALLIRVLSRLWAFLDPAMSSNVVDSALLYAQDHPLHVISNGKSTSSLPRDLRVRKLELTDCEVELDLITKDLRILELTSGRLITLPMIFTILQSCPLLQAFELTSFSDPDMDFSPEQGILRMEELRRLSMGSVHVPHEIIFTFLSHLDLPRCRDYALFHLNDSLSEPLGRLTGPLFINALTHPTTRLYIHLSGFTTTLQTTHPDTPLRVTLASNASSSGRRVRSFRFLEEMNFRLFQGINPITMIIEKHTDWSDILSEWVFIEDDRQDAVDVLVIDRSAEVDMVEELVTRLGRRQRDDDGRTWWLWPHLHTIKIKADGYAPEDLQAMVRRRTKFALANPSEMTHMTYLHISGHSPMDHATFQKLEGLLGKGNVEWGGSQ